MDSETNHCPMKLTNTKKYGARCLKSTQNIEGKKKVVRMST